jgi:hypothetical protein
MTSIEIAKAILANAKDNPVTTVMAIIALGLLGAGGEMTKHGVEPWGTAVAGIGAIIVIVLGFVAKDKIKKDGDE